MPSRTCLHMITADPNRTPNFILFANPDYFLSATGIRRRRCTPKQNAASCFVENPALRGTTAISRTRSPIPGSAWSAPACSAKAGSANIFSDHTDTRPTILRLAGLTDDYAHDGRVLFEALTTRAAGDSLRAHGTCFRLSRKLISNQRAARRSRRPDFHGHLDDRARRGTTRPIRCLRRASRTSPPSATRSPGR